MKLKLYDREITIDGKVQPVYALSSLQANPQMNGLGRHLLRWMEEMAEKDGKYCVYGTCLKEVLGFYTASGWYFSGMFGQRHIITSKKVGVIEITEP